MEFVVIASLLFCDAGCVGFCSLCGAWMLLILVAIVLCRFARLCDHTANWQNKFRKRNVSERYRVRDQSGTVQDKWPTTTVEFSDSVAWHGV